jgi:dipeptidyl aminopeptidase/acylaminoacyl peptidase
MAAVALPDRLADYSHLTADLSDAASGRAVALYQRGFGVEFLDAPQAVVLAADDDVYRRLDAAERRSGPQDQGDPGPMLLSPDGSAVALGDHDAHDPDLGVVDLSTGAVVDHPLPHARSVVPLAWSADGAQIAYLAGESPTNPHSGGPPVGDLFVLDLGSGEASPVPGVERAWMAAFSPDGRELAVRRSGQGNGGTSVVDLSEGTVRVLPVAGALSSPAAWSPDGSLLAVSAPSGLSFVEADGSAPEPVRLVLDDPERAEFLGWTSDREVAVLERSGADTAHLVALPLDGGDARQLTTVDDLGSYGIGRLQLASALLPGIDVRVAAPPDRGPLPARFRIPLALLVGLAAAALVMLGTRATRRHRSVVDRESDSCESTCPA